MNPENTNQGNPRIGTEPEEVVLFPLDGGALDDQIRAWISENPEYKEETTYKASRVVTFKKGGNFVKGLKSPD